MTSQRLSNYSLVIWLGTLILLFLTSIIVEGFDFSSLELLGAALLLSLLPFIIWVVICIAQLEKLDSKQKKFWIKWFLITSACILATLFILMGFLALMLDVEEPIWFLILVGQLYGLFTLANLGMFLGVYILHRKHLKGLASDPKF